MMNFPPTLVSDYTNCLNNRHAFWLDVQDNKKNAPIPAADFTHAECCMSTMRDGRNMLSIKRFCKKQKHM